MTLAATPGQGPPGTAAAGTAPGGGAGVLCIGLMSGTSLDGVDGVLVDFNADDSPAPPANRSALQVLAHAHRALPDGLAAELLALNGSGADELHRAALAANALAEIYAAVVGELLARAGRRAAEVAAVGAHGQTVRHRPGAVDGIGYTLQLNNPALLAERCGIDVVADFRSRDVAAGGQGAPLVPAFHRAVFGGGLARSRAVLNLGGIANLTVLPADGSASGFDCGPANALLDDWCRRHSGRRFDDGGRWAAGGKLLPVLLDVLQREPFFRRLPPKSTGRDLFNADWLDTHLAAVPGSSGFDARDVQHTLAELTAWSCAEAVRRHAPDAAELLVCGGGALNDDLMHRLSARLPATRVLRSDGAGLPSHHVEAAAFAWLALRFIKRQPGNLVDATGASGPRVLGALYPA